MIMNEKEGRLAGSPTLRRCTATASTWYADYRAVCASDHQLSTHQKRRLAIAFYAASLPLNLCAFGLSALLIMHSNVIHSILKSALFQNILSTDILKYVLIGIGDYFFDERSKIYVVYIRFYQSWLVPPKWVARIS